MSNSFTLTQPIAFEAAKEVGRELAPAVSRVMTNFAPKVAIGDTVRIPVADATGSGTYSPAMTTTAGTDSIDSDVEFSLTDNKQESWNLTGENMQSLMNAGMFQEWQRQKLQQGMRRLVALMEAKVLTVGYQGASRATGTAGTTPFATTLGVLTAARKILTDNGCPDDGQRTVIIDTTAAVNALNLAVLQQVNTAGDSEVMTQGRIAKRLGFDIRESAQVQSHVAGTGSSYQSNLIAGYAIGDRAVLVDTGTGTVKAGDVVTFTGDANKYVNGVLLSAPGALSLNRPGLRATLANDVAMAIGSAYTANLAFHRSGILLAARPPIIPDAPNIKKTIVGDPVSGLSFLLCEIVGDGMITWRVQIAYGAAAVNSENICIILG